MSVADVAEVLRFSVRQVEAIEADRYADLPGATLVRGFVRGYAKLLKLDAGPLLAAVAEAVPQGTADVRPPQTLGAAEDAPALDRVSAPGMSRGVWGLAAVLVLAVGLVVEAGLGEPHLRHPRGQRANARSTTVPGALHRTRLRHPSGPSRSSSGHRPCRR